MQFLGFASVALLVGIAAGAPALAAKTVAQRDYTYVTLTYIGAADTSFTLDVKADGQQTSIGDDLSVSYISSNAPDGVQCTSYGIDGSVTVTHGAEVS